MERTDASSRPYTYTAADLPWLHRAVSMALASADILPATSVYSAGPLTETMVRAVEDWLHRTFSDETYMVRQVEQWLDGKSAIIPQFSDAMECVNGESPSADLVLLLWSAREGDM